MGRLCSRARCCGHAFLSAKKTRQREHNDVRLYSCAHLSRSAAPRGCGVTGKSGLVGAVSDIGCQDFADAKVEVHLPGSPPPARDRCKGWRRQRQPHRKGEQTACDARGAASSKTRQHKHEDVRLFSCARLSSDARLWDHRKQLVQSVTAAARIWQTKTTSFTCRHRHHVRGVDGTGGTGRGTRTERIAGGM